MISKHDNDVLDENLKSDGWSNGMKRIVPFFIFNVALPSLDVYSDLSLVIPWYWNGHWKYAASMTVPLCFQFVSTFYKWLRFEKRVSKKWSFAMLLLQCWPQWRAIRIIHLDFQNNEKADAKKEELMREVTTTEPFLEAWPSIIVMTIIWLTAGSDMNYQNYCSENKLWSDQEDFNNNSTWTCDDPIAPPHQYCEIRPEDNKCSVFSGPGGSPWFFTTYAISIVSGSLGITKFLQNGPFSVLTARGLFGGVCKGRFILVFLSVLSSMVTKGFVFALLVLNSLDPYNDKHRLKRLQRILGSLENGKALIKTILISLGTLILPNLLLSLIAISRSTGLNKTFVDVILNYPASWMLPITTYFMIGPHASNCCSQTDVNKILGFSKFYSCINISLTVIMYLASISFFESYDFYYLSEILSMWVPVLVLGLLLNIAYLNLDAKCCNLKLLRSES